MSYQNLYLPGPSSRNISNLMPISPYEDHYKMCHPTRGKCIVFTNQRFPSANDNRVGSNKDTRRICNTFRRLGFSFQTHEDLTCSEIKGIISRQRAADYTQDDCICIFVLTHGTKPGVLAACDGIYNARKIWEPFTARNCPTLAAKPKLFFFQTCRGHKSHKPDTSVTLDSFSLNLFDKRTTQSNVELQSDRTPYTIPSYPDFLLVHSSAEEFSAVRNPKHESRFIQTLCDVLDKDAGRQELLTMLVNTTRRVGTEFEDLHRIHAKMKIAKQVPSFTSTLTKKLYFAHNSCFDTE